MNEKSNWRIVNAGSLPERAFCQTGGGTKPANEAQPDQLLRIEHWDRKKKKDRQLKIEAKP